MARYQQEPSRVSTPTWGSMLMTDRRRLLIGGVAGVAAWVAPSVTGLDAAAAMVSCMPGTLDWDSLVTGSTYTTSVVNGVSVTLTVAPLAGTTLLATNRTIRASPNGSFNQKALQFQQLPNAIGIGQNVTFTFSAPVSNVVFTFYDIDNLVGGWGDRILMLTTGYTSTIPAGSTVIGNGTAGNLFRNSLLNTNFGDTDNRGNLTLTYAGPITSFAFRYTNAVSTGGANQRIGLSDMSWTC